jgi:hypothetical protein
MPGMTPLPGEPRFEPDLRLEPLTAAVVDDLLLEGRLTGYGSWHDLRRLLLPTEWRPDLRCASCDPRPRRPHVDLARWASLLPTPTTLPLGWSMVSLLLRRPVGLCVFGFGDDEVDRMPLLLKAVVEDLVDPRCLRLYTALNPIPPRDAVRLLATDLAAQAVGAVEAGASVVAVVAALLDWFSDADADTAAQEALSALGLPMTTARIRREPLQLDVLRARPEVWSATLQQSFAFFHRLR